MSKLLERRIQDPEGTWDYKHIIGAKVKVKSTPIDNFSEEINTTDVYTVKDILFRVSLDGKVVTRVVLAEAPRDILTWKDLIVVDISPKILDPCVGEYAVNNFITA